MSNFLYHNKWHSFNHHTVPTREYPDSAMDPIASLEFPFKGIFFNNIPVSAVNLETDTKQSIRTYDSDSYGWWWYTSLTYRNSADWDRWGTVRDTITYYLNDWNDAYHGFQFWSGYNYTPWEDVSARMFQLFNNTLEFSAAEVWSLSTDSRAFPISGRGWHIALSGITWRTNVSAVNTRQKNAVPSELSYNDDNTLYWDVSTAQTAYLSLTENRPLTATRIFNVKKGGKYTMWVSLDFCPLEKMNLVFWPDIYRIQVVRFPRETSYFSNLSVIKLQPNTITKIDFVYDGRFMLGKATHYKIFLPTTDDTYYQGLGNTLSPNPWYVDGLGEPDKYILPQPSNGIRIQKISNTFTPVSAIYIAGTGVNIAYFGQGFNFFNFGLVGARWQTDRAMTDNRGLTASFDRVFGNLSGADYNDPTYAINLFATPSYITAPDIMLSAYPNPPYKFTNFNLISVPTCLSSIDINIRSGNNRDIRTVVINRLPASVNAPIVNGFKQKYNFKNERQSVYTYNRVQTNTDFKITYQSQEPINGLNPILWFDFIDSFVTTIDAGKVTRIVSKPRKENILSQSVINSKPSLCETTVFRSAYFNTNGGATPNMTLNRPLTALDKNFPDGVLRFTQFTVIEPTLDWYPNEQVVWWIGDYRRIGTGSGGYGVVLSGNKVCFGGFAAARQKFDTEVSNYTIKANKPFILTTVLEYNPNNRFVSKSSYYINGQAAGLAPGHSGNISNITVAMTSFNIVYGRIPGTNTYSNFKLHSHILYGETLSRNKLVKVNNYLVDKYYINEGYNSEGCSLAPFVPTATVNITWNTNSTIITAYAPPQNENDRPRINTFRSDANPTYAVLLSAGSQIYNIATNTVSPAPWGNRSSGTYTLDIPLPGGTSAGVDVFASKYYPQPGLSPSGWVRTESNADEWKYQYTLQPGVNNINVSF